MEGLGVASILLQELLVWMPEPQYYLDERRSWKA